MRVRRIASVVLIVTASFCVVGALLAGYARTALLDSDQFADRGTAALAEPPVRDLVANKITDEAVLKANRDLLAVRPLVQSAASAIVGSGAFRSLFHRAARDLHRTVFTHDRNTATLTIADVGVLLTAALEQLDPGIAERLPAFDVSLDGGEEATIALDAAQLTDAARDLAIFLGVATAILLVAGILITPDRRRGIVHAGVSLAIAGAALVIAYQIARGYLVGRFSVPADAAAAGAVWDHLLQDLRTWALVLVGVGTVVAPASSSLLRPVDVRGRRRRGWEVVVTVPASPWRRALRALSLVAAGILVIVERDFVVDAGLVLLGVFVLYQGVEELLRMIAERTAARPAERETAEAPARRRRVPAPVLAGAVATVLVVLLLAGLFASGGTEASAEGDVNACNGHAELCDRPVNEVAFAGTHNAMASVTNPGWLFAQQEEFLGGQLEDGVRALLIDAYYGQRVGGRVRTNLAEDKKRADLVAEIGAPAVDAAERIRDRLVGGDRPAGPETTWLCHGFCELGAVTLVDGLREVRDFLVAHPNEVLVIVVQDEGPTPQDVADAFEEAGVLPFVYTGPVGPPWPTLREMIDSGRRVIVMAENEGGGEAIPWYHDAYELMQETPYEFKRPSEFSCEPNRGPQDASLFLLNHWIDTSPAPRPSNAAKVNAFDPLLRRARACERERGLLPNVLAVDFYGTGDLFEVVDALNEVSP